MLALSMQLSGWVIALMVLVGLLLVVAEIFVPSGGVLGVAGALLMIAAIVAGFYRSPVAGVALLIACPALAGAAVSLTVRFVPRSPLARGIVLGESREPAARADGRLASAEADERGELVGRQVKALRDLRPAGLIELDGQRVEAVSEGPFIEAGTTVEIVRIDGRTLVVRAADA